MSDNNGIEDSNKPILKNSQIWKYLNYKTNYFTIEVYTNNIKKLSQQVNIIKIKSMDILNNIIADKKTIREVTRVINKNSLGLCIIVDKKTFWNSFRWRFKKTFNKEYRF